LLVLTRAFFVNNEIYMAFLLNSQAQGVSGKNEQSSRTPWRGAQCSCIGFKAGPAHTNGKALKPIRRTTSFFKVWPCWPQR